MKIAALITVLALACAPALAQNKTGSTDSQAKASSGGLVDKTKRGLQRMGDATRRTGERIGNKVQKATNRSESRQAARSDARSMGAAPDTADSDRRARMDEAYGNWKSRQK